MPLRWAPIGLPPLLSGKYNLIDEWKTCGEVDEIVGESPPLSPSWMSLRWHESWRGLLPQCCREPPLLVYFQSSEQGVLAVSLPECGVEERYLPSDGQALWLPMVFPQDQEVLPGLAQL